ncbi:MAG: carbon-phosphorus lyase complex subunit PhnI [Verrucomicrobiota bacterium]
MSSPENTHRSIELASKLADRERAVEGQEPIATNQIETQLNALVDRVMGEAGLYSPELASIAIKQSCGDIVEAAEILRAHRQSIRRNYTSEILDTEGMEVSRRISSAFREIPGGQILGSTCDYTQRLLEDRLVRETQEEADGIAETFENETAPLDSETFPKRYSRVVDLLKSQGMVAPVNEAEDRSVVDVTKKAIQYPAQRSGALQTLARSDTGGLMAIAYSAMRGQGGDHPTIGELRVGYTEVVVKDGRKRQRSIGRIRVSESANISKIKTRKKDPVPYMSLGYGLCFGQNETKAICMGIVDRSNRIPGDGAPAISQEFSLYHLDGPDSKGFVNSLKAPAYAEMKTELDDLRAAIKRHEAEKQRKLTLQRGKSDESQPELDHV